nr:30s ribosomal protein s1 like [Quercus suber]
MTPVMPFSISNISLIPGTVFATRKNNCLTRSGLARKPIKLTPSPQKCLLPLSTSIRLFPQYSRGCSLHHISRIHRLSATGTDVAVEADSPIADEDSSGASEDPSGGVGGSEKLSTKPDASPTSIMSRRSRPVRKSEMPPVKDEELVPGASFTGKVRSIQPFGAFVDFGAFTDGLVHVSRLSDSYVKDVGSIVSVGQEVKVRLVEANTETGRISLTMRERDDASNLRQQRDSPASGNKAGPANRNFPMSNQRRDEVKKSSKFVKGQDLEGTVKNMTRSGTFISLPDGEEGFLPMSEEVDEGFGTLMGNSSLQVGQEVSVRVLRISRGRVTLTMKKEEDIAKLDSQLNQGVVHAATNPFVLAFRKNKDISMFLDEREKLVKATEAITKT